MAIYLVTTPTAKRLVKADTKAQAINHVIRPGVHAEALDAENVVDHLDAGLSVETATPSPETP